MSRSLALLVAFTALASPLATRASAQVVSAQPAASTPSLPADDRVRLAEAFRLAAAIGDSIWPGWTSAPIAVLLVTPDREFLIRHPRPSADFTRIGYDSLLASEVYVRNRTMSPNFLATFPAVGGLSRESGGVGSARAVLHQRAGAYCESPGPRRSQHQQLPPPYRGRDRDERQDDEPGPQQ